MIPLSSEEFSQLASHIESISGISLDRSKAYLIESRLSRVVRELGLTSFRELHSRAVADLSRTTEKQIINAITTGETLFFRDNTPYELLRQKILPDFIGARTRQKRIPATLRVWSCACSTGQEVYSIAMLLKEKLPQDGRFRTELIATDISDAALDKARVGKYSTLEVERGLPREKQQRYFVRDPDCWRIRDEIRAMVTYQKLNLLDDFSRLGKFDIIFCRNVAIYFSAVNKAQLFRRLENSLQPDGCLIIGATESLAGATTNFITKKYLQTYYYGLQE